MKFLFAHGAGGGMNTGFMTAVARGLEARGIEVVRFEFPYMQARRRVPDREPVLLQAWRDVVAEHGGGAAVAIGGKSMGGRMATMVADELSVRALVCFGYPFHPPKQPEKLRTKHLAALRTPALIIQGERDQFGTRADVAGYALAPSIEIAWLAGADHSYQPRAKENIDRAVELAGCFIQQH